MYQNVIPGVTDGAEATIGSAVIENGEEVKSSAAKGKSARDAVTPLAHLPYTEQLEQKKYSLMQLLKKLVSSLSLSITVFGLTLSSTEPLICCNAD